MLLLQIILFVSTHTDCFSIFYYLQPLTKHYQDSKIFSEWSLVVNDWARKRTDKELNFFGGWKAFLNLHRFHRDLQTLVKFTVPECSKITMQFFPEAKCKTMAVLISTIKRLIQLNLHHSNASYLEFRIFTKRMLPKRLFWEKRVVRIVALIFRGQESRHIQGWVFFILSYWRN